jgi:hypothetical protein
MFPALIIAILAAASSGGAGAANSRSFVASYGNDANPCTISAACRSFAAAVAATTPYGEVIVLDSAGYGPVTIAQSVTIVAPDGVFAGISASPGGIGVAIMSNTIEVRLSGITVVGGWRGIDIAGIGDTVQIDRCVIRDASYGIVAGASRVSVSNSRLIANFEFGVLATNGAVVELDHVKIIGERFGGYHNTGLAVASDISTAPIDASVTNSSFVSLSTGVQVSDNTGAALRTTVAASTFAHSIFGIGVLCNSPSCAVPGTIRVLSSGNTFSSVDVALQVSGQNATLAAAANVIAGGVFGLQNIDGILVSLGNNVVEGTTNPTAGTITPGAPH